MNKRAKKIQEISNNWKGFPNLREEGRYEFLTQTIFVNSVEQRHLQALKTNPKDPILIRKIWKVFIHEITHWLDHTSTLWGQNNLVTIYNAFNAFENEKEDDLWRIIKLFSESSRNHFADYYEVNGPAMVNDDWSKIPWCYEYSCGLQYGSDGKPRLDRPFITTRFSNFDGTLIKRVPMSIASLIETIATAAELQIELPVLTLLKSYLKEDEFLIEFNLFQKALSDRIYDPHLTVYSVAAHCLANSIRTKDIVLAYKYSSALASLCLNLPSQAFEQLGTSYIKRLPLEIHEIIAKRASEMIALRDRGFAFFVLSQYVPETNFSNIPDWLENTVKSAGLPPLDTLNKMIIDEMSKLDQGILDGDLAPRLTKLLGIGRENYAKRGIYGKHEPCYNSLLLNTKELTLPPIVLGDDNIFDVELFYDNPQYLSEDMDTWIFYVWSIEKKLREFQRACIAL